MGIPKSYQTRLPRGMMFFLSWVGLALVGISGGMRVCSTGLSEDGFRKRNIILPRSYYDGVTYNSDAGAFTPPGKFKYRVIEKDHIYNVSVYWNRDIRWHLDDSGADSGFRLDIRYHIEKIHFFPEASEAAAFFIEGGARGGVLVPSFKIIASGTPDYLISKKRRDAIGGLLEIMRPRRVRSQVVFELS